MASRTRPDVAAYQAGHDVDHCVPLDRVQAAYRTEVDETQGPVRQDEDVPRVWIGVEEPHSQDLVEGGPEEDVGEGAANLLGCVEVVDVGDGGRLRTVPGRGSAGCTGSM